MPIRFASFAVAWLVVCCSSHFGFTRVYATIDCGGSPCDIAKSICCVDSNGASSCVQTSSCSHGLECITNADCLETDGHNTLVHGTCCATASTTSPSPFGDAGVTNTSIETSCTFDTSCSTGAFPTCNAVGSTCRPNNGSQTKTCSAISIGAGTMPFGICR